MIIFVFIYCEIILMTSSIWMMSIKPQNCYAPFSNNFLNFIFFSFTRSCSYLIWVYAIMFLFWDSQLTMTIFETLGINQSQLDRTVPVELIDALDEDSNSSEENFWNINSNNKNKRPKSPKGIPILEEDGEMPSLLFAK